MNKNEVINRLKAGNQRYVRDQRNSELQDMDRRISVVNGQEPFAIILSCADSRVVPELVFDTGLGELFVIRVAGNIANTSSIASIEYAVAHCGVKMIVVLGHESCGAVGAAIQGGDNGHNLNHLLSHVSPALDACEKDASKETIIRKNAEINAQALIEKSDIISDFVNKGEVDIKSAFYSLSTGEVDFNE